MRMLLSLLLFTLPLVNLQPVALGAERPNIVFIISDDMGYSDLGCYGGEIETPYLDSLAKKGVRFTNYYVNNMCWPTRASLMTGLYPRTALPKNGSADGGLHPDSTTLPQALKRGGYTTLMSGKWHLSNPSEPNGPNAPHNRGFDKFYGTIFGASDFFAPADLALNGKPMTHEWKGNGDYYYTDATVDHALKFLAEAKEKENPFFLYVAFTAAHWPLHAKQEDIDHYKGKYVMGWDELRIQRHTRMKELGVVNPDWSLSPRHPDVPSWEDEKHKDWQQRRMEVYAAQITCMDRNIGRIVEYLQKEGTFENTIFVYQHDNGGCHVEYGEKRTGSWTREFTTDGNNTPIRPGNVPGLMPGPQSTFQSYGYGWANASNTPFRLFKQHDHEGGTKSPLIVCWPAGIPKNLTGTIAHDICHSIDVMPTLLEVTGLKPAEQKPIATEGRSFLGAITGDSEVAAHDALFWAHAKGKAVRSGNWKLVSANRGKWELYNLGEDGTELNNLADSMPEKLEELKKLHEEWIKRTAVNKGR